tara:strand:- start:326 stop:556 length:231 start_codon:yes stop_codon:yes gene_type:complete
MKKYTVKYHIDHLDTNPTIKTFDCFNEMQDDIELEVDTRMNFFVSHSPYSLTESDIENQREIEYSLIDFEEWVENE